MYLNNMYLNHKGFEMKKLWVIVFLGVLGLGIVGCSGSGNMDAPVAPGPLTEEDLKGGESADTEAN